MFFIMFKNRDEFQVATSESFASLEKAKVRMEVILPESQAFIVSNDKNESISDESKFFVLFEYEDNLESVLRKDFDSWEDAEKYAQGVNKNLNAFAVAKV